MTLHKDLEYILKKYTNGIYLETGLASGESAQAALDLNFKKIISIEIDPESVKQAKEKFKNYIENEKLLIIEGDSCIKLEEVLKEFPDISVIFLDAHDGNHENNAPIEAELDIIKKYYANQLILIDDFYKIKKNDESLDPARWTKKNNYKTIKRKLKEISNISEEFSYGKFGSYNSILINHKIKKYNFFLNIFKIWFLNIVIKILKKCLNKNQYNKLRKSIIHFLLK